MTFTPNTPGIFRGLPSADYHAAPGLSNSMMGHMDPPARLPVYLAEKHEATPEMVLGTLTHHFQLEPDKVPPVVAIKPEGMTFASNVGKAWKAENAGRIIVKETDWKALEGMLAALAKNEDCRRIFAAGESEVSLFAHADTPSGRVLRKARLDWVPPGNALVDLKTAQSAAPEHFAKTLYDSGYYRQAPWYLDIWNALNPNDRKECFVFVVVEKKPPYLVACYNVQAGPDSPMEPLDLGRRDYTRLMNTYALCCKLGEWPGYPIGINPLDVPRWVYKKEGL